MIGKLVCATRVTIMAIAVLAGTVCWAGTYTVLYTFTGGFGGGQPNGSLISDTAGNLYGTTFSGGTINSNCASGCGVVFQLIKGSNGKWTEKVLHSFPGGTGGNQPATGLAMDSLGNLYGTTEFGGNTACAGGCGTVFELIPGSNGRWTWKGLHNFTGSTGGASPLGRLILDASGNVYGTTYSGNNCSAACGTVFELIHNANGTWTYKGIYQFSHIQNGSNPAAGLTFDSLGNLYGTTEFGGVFDCASRTTCGTVFELMPGLNGHWTFQQLFAFTNLTGAYPTSELIFDSSGNLYGTTSIGGLGSGSNLPGNVFELMPPPSGPWTQQILSSQRAAQTLIFDTLGDLFGVATGGGKGNATGLLFELSPGGGWTGSVLHTFNAPGGDFPTGALIFDMSGNLYGTTSAGGAQSQGVAFEYAP